MLRSSPVIVPLWNVIYEFFIKYIFGGYYGGIQYQAYVGSLFYQDGIIDNSNSLDGLNAIFGLNNSGWSMSFGNYLSLIATIISMVVIVLICCALIKKIYNMCAHIIG